MPLVRNAFDYEAMREDVRATKIIAFDTETTGLRLYQGDVLRGISIAGHHDGEWSWYLPVSHPGGFNFDPTWLIKALATKQLYVHHGVFDWTVLGNWWDPAGDALADATVWDSQVGGWLMDENQRNGLKIQGERVFGLDASEEQQALKQLTKDTGRTWDTFTAEDIAAYAEQDAVLTYNLSSWQQKYVDPALMKRELKVNGAVYRMIRRGIQVDTAAIDRGTLEFEESADAIDMQFEGVNVRSPKQLATLLYPEGAEVPLRTKTGAPSTNRAALEYLEAQGNPIAHDLLRSRKLTKAVTAYFRPLKERIGNDGRIHPWFSTTRTVTGRFSCSDPNLQTIPRDDVMPEVRKCFVPAPGYDLWEFDLAQAELRVMASLSREQNMIDALESGADLHSLTAESIFGPDFTPLQRRLAKNLNFGFAYGIGPGKFATYMVPGVPDEATVREAARILDGYRRTYPNLVKTMDRMEQWARKHGTVPSVVPGRMRHFRSPGKIIKTYTALNAAVQGAIAEHMKDVMVEWDQCQQKAGVRLCIQVHDSFWMELPRGTVTGDQVLWSLNEMSKHVQRPVLTLPLRFEGKMLREGTD